MTSTRSSRRAREGRPRAAGGRPRAVPAAAGRAPGLERAHGGCRRRAGSRPCASCATRTSSAISELSQGGPLRCQTCEQPNTTRRISHVDSRSPALLGHLPRPAGALDALRSRCATQASSGTAARSRTSQATLRRDGDALALEGSARVDSISVVEPPAMRASVLGPAVLRRRAPSRDHVPLDGGPPRRRRPGRGRRRAHDPGRHAPGHRQRSATPRRGRAASARSRDCSSTRASTAASSDSTGRWSCRAAATRSAGMWRWTSICCSSATRMRTQ